MVDTLTQPEKFEENKSILRDVYGVLKGLDQYLRFALLTGVSRFAKVNVFSGMNNLQDISEAPQFATVTGFTQGELEAYFGEWLAKLNQKFPMPNDELLGHVRHWYNWFSFDGLEKLYNPFSILSLFANLEFGNGLAAPPCFGFPVHRRRGWSAKANRGRGILKTCGLFLILLKCFGGIVQFFQPMTCRFSNRMAGFSKSGFYRLKILLLRKINAVQS